MSFIKYRVREVAADFGMTPKEVSEVAGKYFDKPKSNSQVLTDEQLNVIFDHITQKPSNRLFWSRFLPPPKPEPKPAKRSPKAAAPVNPARQSGCRPLHPSLKSSPRPSRSPSPVQPGARGAVWWIPPPCRSTLTGSTTGWTLWSPSDPKYLPAASRKSAARPKNNKRVEKFQSSKARSEERRKCAACAWRSLKRRLSP